MKKFISKNAEWLKSKIFKIKKKHYLCSTFYVLITKFFKYKVELSSNKQVFHSENLLKSTYFHKLETLSP